MKWVDELPWRQNRLFHRWLLLIEYSVWAMAIGLFIGAVAAKAEIDYGGSRITDDPWYPTILFATLGAWLSFSCILPAIIVNAAHSHAARVRGKRDCDAKDALRVMPDTARTDGWTWLFEGLLAAASTGLLHATLVAVREKDAAGSMIIEWGVWGFVLAVLPLALVFARRLVAIGRQAWRDRAQHKALLPK